MSFLSAMFPDEQPLFVAIAKKHGYGGVVDHLVEKAFTKGEEIDDLRAVQAILLVASMRCPSNYCSVFHTLIMNSLGVTREEIEYLASRHRFPDSLAELRKYDEFLAYAFFRKNVYVNDDFSFVNKGIFENGIEARRDFVTILLLSDVLLMLTVAFESEVNLEAETFFDIYPTHAQIPDYISYFDERKGDALVGRAPVFTICMHCKRVENQSTSEWRPLEFMISSLPRNARFSHGLCDPCMDRSLEQMPAPRARAANP